MIVSSHSIVRADGAADAYAEKVEDFWEASPEAAQHE